MSLQKESEWEKKYRNDFVSGDAYTRHPQDTINFIRETLSQREHEIKKNCWCDGTGWHPKESEWEKEFEKRFPEAVSRYDIAKELYDAGIAELINKPVEVPTARDVVLMQEYNQLIYRFRKFVSQAISQREQEIARGIENMALDKVGDSEATRRQILSIIKHNQ